MKILSFSLFGDFAHFRKFYTTSSPLSFPFPPPPTIRGIVGAIMGFSKEEYLEKTKGISVGVSLKAPLKKVRMGLNLIFTKGSSGKFDPTLIPWRKGDVNKTLRTQIKAEFIKDPIYRIYLSADEDFIEELAGLLKEHRTNYTVSLGLSELVADFSFEGIYRGNRVDVSTKVDSVVPTELVQEIDLERPHRIGKERVPTDMGTDRKVLRYEDVIFNMDGGSLFGKFKDLIELENGEVVYLWKQNQDSTPTQMSL